RPAAIRHPRTPREQTSKQRSPIKVQRPRARARLGRARRQVLAHTARAAHPTGREAGSTGGIQVGRMSDTTRNRLRSKKTLILEYREAHSLKRVGMPELKAIEAQLGA